MADARVRINKDKVELVRKLVSEDDKFGPFKIYADAIAFAAAFGLSKQNPIKVDDPATDLAPIRQTVFERQGYDTMINLIAVYNKHDPRILADDDETTLERTEIFESYANGGLQILKEELKGAVDYLGPVLLLMADLRKDLSEEEDKSFDLSKLLD